MFRTWVLPLLLLASAPPAFAPTALAQAPAKQEIRIDKDAVLAVSGYDVVSYFDGTPRKGDKAYEAVHHGIKYRFASADNMARFNANPDYYSPMNGGYCVIAPPGKKIKVDPHAYAIIDGRLAFANNKANIAKVKANPEKFGFGPREAGTPAAQ